MPDGSQPGHATASHREMKGWALVGVQMVLLGVLVLWTPTRTWSFPDWVAPVGLAIGILGAIWLLVGAVNLGRSLTPTPVPRDEGTLKTNGLYRLSRHPIYTGILAIALSSALRTGSWVLFVVAGLFYVLFEFKARFEEQMLSETYPGYAAYAARVPRFVPVGRRLL